MKVTITKIDAARRQLREAIKLWFHDGDIVVIHILACSAHQIVHDINRKSGGRDLLYDTLVIKERARKKWIKHIKSPYNFLKHADNDPNPNASIELSTVVTEGFILFSLVGLRLLGYELNEIEDAFIIWFGLTNPSEVRETFLQSVPEDTQQFARQMGKKEFFDYYTLGRRRHMNS